MQTGSFKTDRRSHRAAVFVSLVLGAVFTAFFVWKAEVNAQIQMQEHLAEKVLRFHVLANSDSEEDQALKMKVKEAVLDFLEEEMPEDQDVDQTRDWIRKNTDELEEISTQVIEKEGYDYTVSAAVTTCWFPQKTYGDVTFPQGNYKALRIEIGEAKGQNWWCVLYPQLCFLNAANAVVPEEGKKQLKNVLTEEEYARVTVGTEFEIGWYFLENILTFKDE